MTERIGTVVVGGGQAGLATGYYLQRAGREFTILDAGERVGDPWRARWDSLRVFTPARYDGLPGFPFPAPRHHFPTKDEVADYLEAYADRFDLPVELGVRVDGLRREGDRYELTAGDRRLVADDVVVAMASFQVPTVPAFADGLDPDVVQLHASDYRNPDQLADGDVLVVGAGNSGAEIGLDVADGRRVWLSGREVGHVPFPIESWFGRHVGIPLVIRGLYHRVLTTSTPMGRRRRPEILSHGGPLVRTRPSDIAAAGIERVPRTTGVESGRPVVGEDRVLDVANVVWCTGFRPDFSWIDLPVFGGVEAPTEPVHDRGVVPDAPGCYFVGLFFLHAMTSGLLTGVARDARYVVDHLDARSRGAPVSRGSRLGAPSV